MGLKKQRISCIYLWRPSRKRRRSVIGSQNRRRSKGSWPTAVVLDDVESCIIHDESTESHEMQRQRQFLGVTRTGPISTSFSILESP